MAWHRKSVPPIVLCTNEHSNDSAQLSYESALQNRRMSSSMDSMHSSRSNDNDSVADWVESLLASEQTIVAACVYCLKLLFRSTMTVLWTFPHYHHHSFSSIFPLVRWFEDMEDRHYVNFARLLKRAQMVQMHRYQYYISPFEKDIKTYDNRSISPLQSIFTACGIAWLQFPLTHRTVDSVIDFIMVLNQRQTLRCRTNHRFLYIHRMQNKLFIRKFSTRRSVIIQ